MSCEYLFTRVDRFTLGFIEKYVKFSIDSEQTFQRPFLSPIFTSFSYTRRIVVKRNISFRPRIRSFQDSLFSCDFKKIHKHSV